MGSVHRVIEAQLRPPIYLGHVSGPSNGGGTAAGLSRHPSSVHSARHAPVLCSLFNPLTELSTVSEG